MATVSFLPIELEDHEVGGPGKDLKQSFVPKSDNDAVFKNAPQKDGSDSSDQFGKTNNPTKGK